MGAGSSEEARKKYFNSIYWESRTWETDKVKSGGIRLNRDAIFNHYLRLPGKLPIETFHSPWGIQFSKSIITTPNVPPTDVILLWQRLFRLEQVMVDKQGVMVGPYFTLAEFAVLYKYLASVSTIDGDEAAWASISAGVFPLTAESPSKDYDAYLIRLCQVYGSSFTMASAYASLCGTFGMHEGVLGVLTRDQWVNQKYLRRVTSAEDYEHVINELVTKLIPAPNYNLPSQSCFDQGMSRTPPSLSISDLGWMQGWLIGVFYQYTAAYPAYEAHMSRAIVIKDPSRGLVVTSHHYLNTWERISSRIVSDWKHCFGEKVTYAQMKEKWPGQAVTKPIESCPIVLNPRTSQKNFWQPCPTENEVKDMMAFDALFHGSSQNQVATEWITRIAAFTNRLKVIPTESGFNAAALRKQVENPQTTEVGKLAFQNLCIIYDSYVSYIRSATHDWKRIEEAYWDETGHTKTERDRIDTGGVTPEDKATDQLAKYPTPHLLNAKEYADFLADCFPIPKIRARLAAEDADEYAHKVTASTTGYVNWARFMTENRAKTAPRPNGIPIGDAFPGYLDVQGQGKGQLIYNYYPDYGVWELPEKRTGWQKFLNFLFNPYKSLTGKALLDELLGNAQKVLNFMLEAFRSATDSVGDVLKKYGVYIAGGAVLFIVGVREIGNAAQKIK